jgi:hypothetical protein
MKRRSITALLLAVSAALFVATQAPSWGTTNTSGGISHEQLESDRVMTAQMGGAAPGMTVQMPTDGMLSRSADAAYVRALEEHTRLFEKMAGLGT